MATWNLDPMHSEVQFKVKHLVISTVTGKFNSFTATMDGDVSDYANAKVHFSADINSIDTGNSHRDTHLKSDDFFNAEAFPHLTFESTKIEKAGDGYKLSGNMTIRDKSLPVVLDVEFGGVATDMYGQTKAGFEISGKINRKEFGLAWTALTEAGGLVVGDEVRLIANVQMTKA